MNVTTARRIVVERSGGICEVCWSARAASWHHRRPRSQGGLWTPANGLHTCGNGTVGCHGWIEHHRTDAYLNGWLVHSWEDPRDIPVHFGYFGRVLLDDDGLIHQIWKEEAA